MIATRSQALGVATVIDLRSDDEVAWSDDVVAPGAVRHHLPLGDLLATGDDWERWRDPMFVADRYFDLCRSGTTSITEIFAVLTDPAIYPVVVQCSLGKDRTGVVVALVLRAIGVPVGHIVEEFSRSRYAAFRMVDAIRSQLDDEHRQALGPYLPALLAADPFTMLAVPGPGRRRVRFDHGLPAAPRHRERDPVPRRRVARVNHASRRGYAVMR